MSFDEQPMLGVEPLMQKALRSSFAPRALDLWIEGVEPALSVRRVSLRGQISNLFSLTIVAPSPPADFDLEAMLFLPASFTIIHRRVRASTRVFAAAEHV